jgi:UDP-N-acetylmuramoyl-L-alanyl-D-glutamate--2,6-diaminopimelate ligase
MESVSAVEPFNVFVDCAHTDDALRRALAMLRTITPGKLRVVFGCGGLRDRTKRAAVVRVAQNFADHAYATADNPRTERLGQIFDDMRAGVTAPGKISWIDDRREAIATAIAACRPGDSLVIAGKGHETQQEFADTVFPFDDRLVAREILSERRATT